MNSSLLNRMINIFRVKMERLNAKDEKDSNILDELPLTVSEDSNPFVFEHSESLISTDSKKSPKTENLEGENTSGHSSNFEIIENKPQSPEKTKTEEKTKKNPEFKEPEEIKFKNPQKNEKIEENTDNQKIFTEDNKKDSKIENKIETKDLDLKESETTEIQETKEENKISEKKLDSDDGLSEESKDNKLNTKSFGLNTNTEEAQVETILKENAESQRSEEVQSNASFIRKDEHPDENQKENPNREKNTNWGLVGTGIVGLFLLILLIIKNRR